MRRVNLLRAHGSPTGYLYHNRHDGCRCVACCAARAGSNRKYRTEHPEECAERHRVYDAGHVEHRAAYTRKYNAEHREERAARDRKRYVDHAAEITEYNLQRKYGISTAERDAMLAAQGNCCAICGTTEPGGRHGAWYTDHDHATGKVRGILCHKHNTGLGNFDDNPAHLMAAIEYLAAAT